MRAYSEVHWIPRKTIFTGSSEAGEEEPPGKSELNWKKRLCQNGPGAETIDIRTRSMAEFSWAYNPKTMEVDPGFES